GKSPFPGRPAIEVSRAERQGPPPPLSKVAPHPVPDDLANLLYCCLSYRRDDRPQTALDLDARLEACAVQPAWTTEEARGWWRDRGPAAMELARGQREERTQLVLLASESGGGRRG